MTSCPGELGLTRAISEGASDELLRHLATCEACRTQHQRLERVIEAAREVGAPIPSQAHREEARTALLAAASVDKPRARPLRHRVWVGALAAAAIVVVVVLARSEPVIEEAAAHRHGTIRPRPLAAFTPVTAMPDEIVALHDGTIDVAVAPLHPGERFRVIVGDAQVEVHGTEFAVTARAGRLIDVVVTHGVVEVRSRDARLVLTAGQSWREPIPAPATIPAPVVPAVVVPPVTLRTAKVPAAPRRVPEELAYDDGWAAMRASRFTQAASAFARVQLLAPTGPLAEDAGFWYAVALARSGQPLLAGNAFRDLLEAFPQSRRVGEASAMLGWILVAAGEPGEAERRFRVASTDRNPDIRASATAGLAAVAKLKSNR